MSNKTKDKIKEIDCSDFLKLTPTFQDTSTMSISGGYSEIDITTPEFSKITAEIDMAFQNHIYGSLIPSQKSAVPYNSKYMEITNEHKIYITYYVISFYIVDYLYYLAKTRVVDDPYLHSIKKFYNDISNFKENYDKNLARVLFDYMVVSCFGEARHGIQQAKWNLGYKRSFKKEFIRIRNRVEHSALMLYDHLSRRGRVHEDALNYDPKQILEYCYNFFNYYTWSKDYGGKKWAKIAKYALTYFDLPASVFIDQVVNLSHNRSICFDKGFNLRFDDTTTYLHLLNLRKESSDLNELTNYSLNPVKEFMFRAKNLNLIRPNQNSHLFFDNNMELNFYDPIVWGKKNILINGKLRKVARKYPKNKNVINLTDVTK